MQNVGSHPPPDPRDMPDPDPTAADHLERARDVVWEALRLLEEAQRIVFNAGDRYVTEVWGSGVRSVIDLTESMAEVSGDLSALHIEMGKMVQRDRARPEG
jgi:hypothetical protein